MKRLLVGAASALALTSAAHAAGTSVDLELLFVTDVSGSIDGVDFQFAKDGYEAAFRNPATIALIESGAIGSIAVSFAFFSSDFQQSIDWTVVNDAASANALADAIAALVRPGLGGSDDLVGAFADAVPTFDNDFMGTRSVIDIVTEGADDVSCDFDEPVCVPVQDARDAALASGITTVNALVLDDREFFGNDPGDIIDAETYAMTNIIGGLGAFVLFAENFDDFAAGIQAKLEREIRPPEVPIPGALPLFATVLGAGFLRRRRKAKVA